MRPLISPSILWLWTLVVLSANHGSAQDTSAVASTEVCQSRTINYITHTLPQQCLRTSWSAANSIINTNTTNAATTTATTTLDTILETATTIGRSTDETATSESSTQSKAPERQNATEKNEDGPDEERWIKQEGQTKQEDDDAEDLATSSFMSFEEWKARMLRKSGQDPADHKEKKHRVSRDADPAVTLETWGDDGEIALDFDVLSDKISEMTAPARARSTPASSNAAKAEVQEPAPYDDGVAHYRRPKDAGKTCKERFSYSSFDGGATVLKTSPGAQNAKAILVENKDSYMLFECKQENRFVIVELSDDILVDTVVLANFEFFSSMIRTFRVSVSDKYPVKIDKWKDIGTFQARNSRDLQSFLIENPMIWAKYIRIEFLSHYGNEFYCPVSLLRVHGTRMLDSWKDAEAGAEEDEPAETITGPEAVPEQEIVHEEAPPAAPEATHIAEQPTPIAEKESNEPVGPRSSMAPPHSSSVSRVANSPSSKAATSQHHPGQPSKANQSRNATSTTSSAPASPTIQESFFKSVSKRLQFLESNTTMSLQYIEEQSRFLQEALKKMERKQIYRVDTFLSNLNNTVFSELQKVRQDYDQIWQSTVIALETQREQSQRDILALRDEVRFQKHMAIFQAVMLLCCLVLVVFSRGVLGNTGIVGDQWPVASTSQFINSYLASPRWSPGSPRTAARVSTPVRNSSTLHPGDKVLPMTPTSEGFDSHDNDTDLGSPMPTPPRPQTPTIRAHKPGPEGIPDIHNLGQEDSSSAPDMSEEVVSSSDDAPTGVPDSLEAIADVEEGEQRVDEDKTQQSSKAFSTRPPLLGPDEPAASRKPLPALPEQVST
ncbi:hypothetical protein SLS53_007117 [Cytospora paraplurivora]|uniref:SUN domain-containing protein n=1 Tax=Cytospora paraplurivora TaxID=2898453 RepID=A0AAN9U4C2_9PEZI